MDSQIISELTKVTNDLQGIIEQAKESKEKLNSSGVTDLEELELMKKEFFFMISQTDLNGVEFSVMMLVYHATVMKDEYTAELPLSLIKDSTKKSIAGVKRAIRRLSEDRFIILTNYTPTTPRTLRINFNYGEWGK